MEPFLKIAGLKTADAFRAYCRELGIDLPCDNAILKASESPLSQPLPGLRLNGKTLKNRWVIHPMEGWDGTRTGAPSEDTRRRWRRFGESGAKLIFGGEAMAIRPDGRANPNQLILNQENLEAIRTLRLELLESHAARFGDASDVVVGFQLTHSGRFCRPNDPKQFEPRVAVRHPLLDARFRVTRDDQVFTDEEIRTLIRDYVVAARLAWKAGADFVDLKHCHGYLLHEFLGAHTRPGDYGGSFQNRTRILREIVAGIRADGNPIDLAVRLSAFDMVPFKPDPTQSSPGRPGVGIPEDFSAHLPYRYGFGVRADCPTEPDPTEPREFLKLCHELGIRLVNLTAGSPYYNPHIQRPAAYPPSDGYQPPEDPLVGVARQIQNVRILKQTAPEGMALIGTGYSYLQEYLPQVAQALVREGWVDLVGIGRMVLSYPGLFEDATREGKLVPKWICRTFSDCTTAPRNGMISGCFPLDKHYSQKPEYQALKALKRGAQPS